MKDCKCPGEIRLCRGCYADVTETMFCGCGEFPLTLADTISAADAELHLTACEDPELQDDQYWSNAPEREE
jgi:hypothetical protein